MLEVLAAGFITLQLCSIDTSTKPATFAATNDPPFDFRPGFIAGWGAAATGDYQGADCVKLLTSWGSTFYVVGPAERFRKLFPNKEILP